MDLKPILLGVNIDHCATVRQARYRTVPRDRGGMVEPDPLAFALAAERAGADGITMHLREDRRHIQESDVRMLRECIQTRLNLEMAATAEMLDFARDLLPHTICLVPESREEITTEGGLDVESRLSAIQPIVEGAHEAGIAVSLFIDPVEEQIDAAAALKVEFVELHTGSYANAYADRKARQEAFETLHRGVTLARDQGLTVNAGHGINYVNIRELRGLPSLHELNIGHSIVSRSLFTGVDEAVREMKHLMVRGF